MFSPSALLHSKEFAWLKTWCDLGYTFRFPKVCCKWRFPRPSATAPVFEVCVSLGNIFCFKIWCAMEEFHDLFFCSVEMRSLGHTYDVRIPSALVWTLHFPYVRLWRFIFLQYGVLNSGYGFSLYLCRKRVSLLFYQDCQPLAFILNLILKPTQIIYTSFGTEKKIPGFSTLILTSLERSLFKISVTLHSFQETQAIKKCMWMIASLYQYLCYRCPTEKWLWHLCFCGLTREWIELSFFKHC